MGPAFRRFWLASTVSDVGSYVTAVAVPVLVVQTLHGSAVDLGLVNAGRWLPYLLVGVAAGVFIERRRRRPLLVGTDLGRGALLLAVPVLAWTDTLTIPLLVAFMIAFGAFSLVGDAAFQSFLPRVVERHELAAANARLDQSDAVAQTSGPALGGLLAAGLGAPGAVLVDAASFLFSGATMARVDVVETAAPKAAGFSAELREGLRWVYRHPTLTPLTLSTHVWFLFFAAFGTVFAPYALRTQHVGALGLGLVISLGGVGGLLGALSAVRLGERFGAGRVVIASRALCAAGIAVAAASSLLPRPVALVALGAAQFIVGLSLGCENANEMGFQQALTPDRLQARTSATKRSINRAMIVIGAPLGGLLGDQVGYPAALAVAAAGVAVASAGLALTPFRRARIASGPSCGDG